MVIDHLDGYRSLTAAICDVAGKLGCSPDSLRVRQKQAQRDAGREPERRYLEQVEAMKKVA